MGAASSCVVQASHGGGLLQSTGSMVWVSAIFARGLITCGAQA